MSTPDEEKKIGLKEAFEAAKLQAEKDKLEKEMADYVSRLQANKASNVIKDKDGNPQPDPLDEMIAQMGKLDIETYIEWATIMMRIFKGWTLLAEHVKAEGYDWYGAYNAIQPLVHKAKSPVAGLGNSVSEKLAELGIRDYNVPTYDFSFSAKIDNTGKLATDGLMDNKKMPEEVKKLMEDGLINWAKIHNYNYEPTEKVFKHETTGSVLDNKALKELNQIPSKSFSTYLKGMEKMAAKYVNEIKIGGENEPESSPSPKL